MRNTDQLIEHFQDNLALYLNNRLMTEVIRAAGDPESDITIADRIDATLVYQNLLLTRRIEQLERKVTVKEVRETLACSMMDAKRMAELLNIMRGIK